MKITVIIEADIPYTGEVIRREIFVSPAAVTDSPGFFLHRALMDAKRQVESEVKAAMEKRRIMLGADRVLRRSDTEEIKAITRS